MDMDAIVSGVMFDLMGYLTTRNERLVLSAHDDAAPAVQVLEEFAAKRRISLVEPDWGWHGHCLAPQPNETPGTANARRLARSRKPEPPLQNLCIVCDKPVREQLGNGTLCRSCAVAQSIIVDGLDLQDQGLNGADPAHSVEDKLRLLIENGWHS